MLLSLAIAPAQGEAHRSPKRPKFAAAPTHRAPTRAAPTHGELALRFAKAQLGKPYRSGATGPYAYDCSGLAQQAWRAAGITIPRTSRQQAHFGAAVAVSRIQPGDLVIFYADASHVGVYAGRGIAVVATHPGSAVKLEAISSMPVHGVRRP